MLGFNAHWPFPNFCLDFVLLWVFEIWFGVFKINFIQDIYGASVLLISEILNTAPVQIFNYQIPCIRLKKHLKNACIVIFLLLALFINWSWLRTAYRLMNTWHANSFALSSMVNKKVWMRTNAKYRLMWFYNRW